MIDQMGSDQIYSEMFKAFDFNNSGSIDREDLDFAGKGLGWDSQ